MGFVSEHRFLVAATVIASLAFSGWCIYADPVVNNDGIRYFRAASAFAGGDFSGGAAIYKWPFFSLMIAGLSNISGMHVEYAAYFLNGILTTLLLVAFLSVVHELGADRTTLTIAAIVILLFPELNKYRSFIIRDTGYLAFYMWSLVFLFRYWKTWQPGDLWKWLLCAGVACLFRPEGVVFLTLVPMLAWMRSQVSPARRFGQYVLLAALCVALFAGLALWLFSSEPNLSQVHIVSQPLQALETAWQQIGTKLWFKLTAIEEEVLTEFSSDYSPVVLLVALTVIVVLEVIRRLSVVYALFVGHAVVAKLVFPDPDAKELWYRLIALNLILLFAFATVQLFLVGRYTVALLLTLLLAAPFSLAHLYRRWRSGAARRAWIFPAIALVVFALGAESLDVYTDKRFLREAGLWLRDNTPGTATVYGDNQAFIYYSGKPAFRDHARYDWAETMSMISREEWRKYDYLGVYVSGKQAQRQARIQKHLARKPAKVFANKNGDKILIFKTS